MYKSLYEARLKEDVLASQGKRRSDARERILNELWSQALQHRHHGHESMAWRRQLTLYYQYLNEMEDDDE